MITQALYALPVGIFSTPIASCLRFLLRAMASRSSVTQPADSMSHDCVLAVSKALRDVWQHSSEGKSVQMFLLHRRRQGRVEIRDMWSNLQRFLCPSEFLCIGSRDGRLYVLDARTGRSLTHFFVCNGGVWCLAFDHRSQNLAMGGHDGRLYIWSVPTNALRRELFPDDTLSHSVLCVAYECKGSLLAVGFAPGRGRIQDSLTWQTLFTFRNPEEMYCLCSVPRSRSIAVGAGQQLLQVCTLTGTATVHRWGEVPTYCKLFCMSSNCSGEQLAVGMEDPYGVEPVSYTHLPLPTNREV